MPNPSESWYVLPKREKILAIETCNSFPFAKFLYFVSINVRESVIKLVALRKGFANCKSKYLGKILKIGHGRNICKECENVIFLIKFLNSDIDLLDLTKLSNLFQIKDPRKCTELEP